MKGQGQIKRSCTKVISIKVVGEKMKILMVNKFYYIKGGSETYYFSLKNLLERKGNTVIDFSMKDEKNFHSKYKDFFVDNVDYGAKTSIRKKIKLAINIIYSEEAKKKFEKLVIQEKPDLIHLHIFQHQISPSILDIAKKYNIPVVYTAHDLKMICLNYKMMHHGAICEACKNGRYYHCLVNKCVKESFAKSAINVIEGYLHKYRHSYDNVNVIITPSAFYMRKFEEFGIESRRLVHIPNFLSEEKPVIEELQDNEKYYLYFGRLSEEKGILTLINAVSNINVKLYIVGLGPLKNEIEQYIKNKNLSNIFLLGFKSGNELKNIIGNSKAVVLPSEWYENGPYSAIESLQLGRPIIGANIGGIPELVKENGFLFESRNMKELEKKLLEFEQLDSEKYELMKKKSELLFAEQYTPESHYKRIIDVYRKALAQKR